MPRVAKLRFEILEPLVQRGLTTKQMAFETGYPLRMVNRRLKALGLRKKRAPALSGRPSNRQYDLKPDAPGNHPR
ncbi:MAG: hypothetical protein JWR80_6527 [Bradyrhizobium sp.]|nr:hypothetical protein [Bradyrhizobium sp.]